MQGIMSAPIPNNNNTRLLACVLCQRRKIKCDHNTPCSHCLKANVPCVPRTPARPRQRRRRRNQDLQDRLSRCEDLLSQYARAGPPPSSAGSSSAGSLTPNRSASASGPPSRSEPSSDEDQPSRSLPFNAIGRMIQDDAGARFMDSHALAAVLENLQAIRDIIDTEEPDDGSTSGFDTLGPADQPEPLLGVDEDVPADIQDLQPDPVHAFRLWKLFLERVNPLLKIVHVPTLQPHVLEGAVSITNVRLSYQALIFAIYMISSISVSEAEAPEVLGMSREEATQRYTKGMKIALVQLDVLKNYDMEALQALVIYVVTLEGRYDRHATWVLSGTVMRIAQKMGYHRDGERLKLSPFETEMRRRIWWQLLTQDFKYATMSGLNRSLFPVDWDTKRPSNLNDSDLYPGLAEHVQERDRPTEMAFVLVVIEIGKTMMLVTSDPGFDAALIGQSLEYALGDETKAATDLESLRLILRDLDDNLREVEKRFLDASAGNVHSAALSARPLLAAKLPEVLAAPDPWLNSPQERLMKMIVIYLEQVAEFTEVMDKRGFMWFVEAHFHLEAFSVLTGLLAERPDSPLADRAWECIRVGYDQHPEIYNITQKLHYEQAVLTLKAWQARVRATANSGHPIPATQPEFVARLMASIGARDLQEHSDDRGSRFLIAENPSHRMGLNSLLSGYFDLSHFRRDDLCHPAPATSQGLAVPVTELR